MKIIVTVEVDSDDIDLADETGLTAEAHLALTTRLGERFEVVDVEPEPGP